MLHVAQHDRRSKPLQRFITSTNHSRFSTSVRSTRFPFAMLRPRAEKDVHAWGRFGKSAWASEVGTITKRGPGPDMKSTTFFLFSRVRQLSPRLRQYQTTHGSSNSTDANRM